VLEDVLDGYVSAGAAESKYGVAIDEANGTINERKTTQLRKGD
jgi:hypothetical protein